MARSKRRRNRNARGSDASVNNSLNTTAEAVPTASEAGVSAQTTTVDDTCSLDVSVDHEDGNSADRGVSVDDSSNTPDEAASLNLNSRAPSKSSDPDPIVERLDEVLERFGALESAVSALAPTATSAASVETGQVIIAMDEDERLQWSARLESLQASHDDLVQQNADLAARLAQSSVGEAVQDRRGGDESMSWEERKQMMLRQMEDDTFDAEAFIGALGDQTDIGQESEEEPMSPAQWIEAISERMIRAEQLAADRLAETEELRTLLQQQRDDRENFAFGEEVVTGASAIAGLVDADELVQEERQRLQDLKDHWEDKFRQTEIAASLERAKLSRERQELARRTAELEEKFEDLKRQQRQVGTPDSGGRRWLAELGLAAERD